MFSYPWPFCSKTERRGLSGANHPTIISVRILIAEDEATNRLLLERTLQQWGHEVMVTEDGQQACDILKEDDPPKLAILDWMMPEMDGVEVCRWARRIPGLRQLYVIMLTTLDSEDDIVKGLEAGAGDYVTKPFRRRELQARIEVGSRIIELQSELAHRIEELEASLAREKTLQGLLPICSYCKKVRNDDNYWQQVEGYIEAHADVSFSHGICPDCYTNIVEPQLEELKGSDVGGK